MNSFNFTSKVLLTMKDIYNKLKRLIIKNYILPEEAKKKLAQRNAGKIIHLQYVIIALCIILTSITYFTSNRTFSEHNVVYINNITMIVLGVISLFMSLFVKKHPDIKGSKQMFPLHFTFLYVYVLVGYIFFTGHSLFNSFLIFASISIITPLYFDTDPFVFLFLELGVSLAIAHKTYNTIGIVPTIDIFIFVILTNVLAFNKWRTGKSDFQYKKEQKEYKERMEKELSLAALVQTSFFKHEETLYEEWTIGYYTKAMSGVSGDFLDIYNNGNKLEGIGIFDVSGHGIASGLVTMLVKNIIINEFNKGKTDKLKTVIDRINVRYLHEKGSIENYLTGILCRINKNNIEFVNAGHSMPILYKHSEEKCVEIKNENSERAYGAIGLIGMPSNFVQHEVTMESGDELILFTDGITDTSNEIKEPFGRDRLIRSINRNADRPLTTQINCIISDVTNYAHGLPLEDDITMIVLKKK